MIRLSELVSALTPSHYAELSLVLFLLVFAGVLFRHGGKRRAAEHAACAQLPLVDERREAIGGWGPGIDDAGGRR
jgi:hypothetical protein